MTGYGAGEGPVAGGRLQVEIRTVNHRFFHLSTKLPGLFAPLEATLRERLRRDFDRGHVTITARWLETPGEDGGSVVLNLERARDVVARLRELQATLGVAGDVDLGLVAQQPEVLVSSGSEVSPLAWTDVEPVVVAAIAECKAMRHREGEVLVAELGHRLDLMERGKDAVLGRAPHRAPAERDRLRTRLSELLDGRSVDRDRVELEIALLADKLDLTEELVRLEAHIAASRRVLGGDEPMGKKLGFLAQELGREINTIGSKANDAEISAHVIAMKGELEKLREQLENLE